MKNEYHPLYINGSFILGQEQDGLPNTDPLFDPKQGFSGKLSQVELWNTVLHPSDIQKLADCVVSTLKRENRVITWEQEPILENPFKPKVVDAWHLSQVSFKDVSLKKFCSNNPISNQFIWPRAIDQAVFNSYCETMDGILPMTNNKWQEVYNNILHVFQSVNDTFPSGFLDKTKGSGIRCFSETSAIDFWMGMKRNPNNGKWYSPYNSDLDLSNLYLKAKSNYHNCVYIYDAKPKTSSCLKVYPCGICKISVDKVLYLKGLCKDDLDLYDEKYYVYGLKNNRPYFK